MYNVHCTSIHEIVNVQCKLVHSYMKLHIYDVQCRNCTCTICNVQCTCIPEIPAVYTLEQSFSSSPFMQSGNPSHCCCSLLNQTEHYFHLKTYKIIQVCPTKPNIIFITKSTKIFKFSQLNQTKHNFHQKICEIIF